MRRGGVCEYGETRERCAALAKVDNEPLADARADVGNSELGADQRQGERLVLYRLYEHEDRVQQ
jgi:hypothetical protein